MKKNVNYGMTLEDWKENGIIRIILISLIVHIGNVLCAISKKTHLLYASSNKKS